ncbi:hypothetical protein QM012_003716 [Aureobasidium pullulans]|uniref:Myb-like domain-containing protein n=1 Tax=Aureobasidium pullulans TaxID=5580 RepID=A0ABR0T918_AURPU
MDASNFDLLLADITPANILDVDQYLNDLDTGLGEGFDFNNPLEPSPSPARTGNQAAMVHHGDILSLANNADCYDPWSRCFLDGGFAFWHRHIKPTFVKQKVDLSWGQEPVYSDLEEEVSEEETDSEEDRRPARSAWKRPVPAGSVEGDGEWHSSGGVPHADAPEWQQDEDDEEEFEDDDDDNEYERPARLSVAPAPTISSRKASAWSIDEDDACIKYMKEVCTLAQYAAIAGTEKRFEVVADRMKREAGFNRTASGVKLQWNRRLRAASKFEDRGEKKRASGLTTSALGQGTKRGTPAASLVSSKSSKGTKPSTTSAQSTETSSLSGRRNSKRKAIFVDSDDEDDDDFFFSAPRSYPAKGPRVVSASCSTLPSTQDVAYYDLSTDNILSGPRSSRYKSATTAQASNVATTPARPSRQKLIATNTINDDADDEEEEVIPAPKPSARSDRQKRARTINDDEDDKQSTAAPQPKRAKRMSSFDPVHKISKKDNRILDKNNINDLSEIIDPRKHYTRPIAPEPDYNKKSYWVDLLRQRQARLARQREEAQRLEENEREDEDEEPVVTIADRARKSRELRKQKTSSITETASTTGSSARRFGRLSPIAEQAEHFFNSGTSNANRTIRVTAAEAAQIANDEDLARQMQQEWNQAPAPRSRRGRGFK